MSALQTSLAQAGKLKQFCQAVLDVVGAAEQMAGLQKQIADLQAQLEASSAAAALFPKGQRRAEA